MSLRQ